MILRKSTTLSSSLFMLGEVISEEVASSDSEYSGTTEQDPIVRVTKAYAQNKRSEKLRAMNK